MSPMPMWVLLWFGSVVSWGVFTETFAVGFIFTLIRILSLVRKYMFYHGTSGVWYNVAPWTSFLKRSLPLRHPATGVNVRTLRVCDILKSFDILLFQTSWHPVAGDWNSTGENQLDWPERRWEISLNLRSSQRSTKACQGPLDPT